MITKQSMGEVLKQLAEQQGRSREMIAIQTGLSVYTVNRVLKGAPRTGWVAYLIIGVSLGYLPAEYKKLLHEKYHNQHKKILLGRFTELLERYRPTPREVHVYDRKPVWVDICIYLGMALTLACVLGIMVLLLRS